MHQRTTALFGPEVEFNFRVFLKFSLPKHLLIGFLAPIVAPLHANRNYTCLRTYFGFATRLPAWFCLKWVHRPASSVVRQGQENEKTWRAGTGELWQKSLHCWLRYWATTKSNFRDWITKLIGSKKTLQHNQNCNTFWRTEFYKHLTFHQTALYTDRQFDT